MKSLTTHIKKRAPMQTICDRTEETKAPATEGYSLKKETRTMSVVQVFIFKGEECLGMDCFHKETIVIGSKKTSDISLDHQDIAESHAVIQLDENGLNIRSCHSGKIQVSGKALDSCLLKPYDFIGVGPYTLKVKMARGVEHSSLPMKKALTQSESFIKDQGRMDEGPNEGMGNESDPIPSAIEDMPVFMNQKDAGLLFEEEYDDDEMEDDSPAPFLTDVLFQRHKEDSGWLENHAAVEIIKIKRNRIVDVRHLNQSEKYSIPHLNRRFCLAEYKAENTFHIYFDENVRGRIQKGDMVSRDLAEFQNPTGLHGKSKGRYRIKMSWHDQAFLEDDDYQYCIKMVHKTVSPEIADTFKTKSPVFKNLFRSTIVHLIALFILGLVASIHEKSEIKDPEMYFAKIDVDALKKQYKTPKAKPEKIPTVRPAEKLTMEKPAPTTKVTPIVKQTADKSKQPASKINNGKALSTNAGGGSGKGGNVTNRNINQTGILGMIGDSIGITPRSALATVTNLDLVSSPGAGPSNMKVGGIVGKLSTGDLSIPTGGVVRSKGSGQVLRSIGVSGKGSEFAEGKGKEIAALEKGKTGQKAVMGMVSVDLNKSAKVQGGGMTREAVKNVIDQHLDEISFCYENALMDSPTLMGNIVFEWKILMSGRVGEVQIKSSTVRSDQIHACIKSAIKTWQFPQPSSAEVVVSYPFVFNIVGF